MSGFKLTLALLAMIAVTAPAAAAEGDADGTRHDPYAGYRARYTSPDRPQRVEHQPRLIRAKPLIREHNTYLNAPAPVDVRVRTPAPPDAAAHTDTLRGRATVVIDRPVVRIDRYRYEDIGKARVVRNPLIHADQPDWHEKIVKPVRPIRHDAYLTDLRHRRDIPRSFVRIRSYSTYDCFPNIYHRPIIRPYHGRHGWRHRSRWHHRSRIGFHRSFRSDCAPSSRISLYFEF